MTAPNLVIRPLYFSVRNYVGDSLVRDVLEPWLAESAAAVREGLAPLAVYGAWSRIEYEWGDLLEQAYALSRLSDLLLLGFQPEPPPNAEPGLAHFLHMPERIPHISEGEYTDFLSALGMRRVRTARFDPFFHEIAAVEQSKDPDDPIEVADELWPCVMFGEMLFGRAGVRVRAGARHAIAGLADTSTLHEVFIRRHRYTSDLSLGWGGNSQWKTDFRRDYLTVDAYHFNVDETTAIDEDNEFGDNRLSVQERSDLLRHRCLTRPLASIPEPDKDCRAGGWSLSFPRQSATSR